VSSTQDRLQEALAAEHAAVYGYGVLGAHLVGVQQTAARDAEQAHRGRRDALTEQLTTAGATPTPAAPAYRLPSPVRDAAGALALALTLEERTGNVWGAALPDLGGTDRSTALAALADCAVRATGWRRAAGKAPATVPFPGRP
jgi:hypothetical protein